MQKRIGVLFLLAIIGGLLFNTLGLGAQTIASFLFIVYLYAIFFFTLRPKLQSNIGIFLMARVLILALIKSIYMADNLLPLNNMILFITFLASLVLLSGISTKSRRKVKILKDIGRLFLRVPQSLKVSCQEFAQKYLHRIFYSPKTSLRNKVMKILRGLLIAAPLLLLIYALLSSADPIFKDIILGDIGNSMGFLIFTRLKHLPAWMSIGNSMGFLIITIIIISFFYQFRTHQQDKKQEKKIGNSTWLNSTTAATILIVMNLIYFIFCYVQIKYLFGASPLPPGFTYAQYAVQGFWQLVIVNLINMGALLATTAYVGQTKLIKTILTITFACTTIIFIAGYERMHLYLSMYGYSYARILALSFMFLIGAWIIISFVKVFYKNFKISKYYIITFLIYYLTINIINIGKLVVNHNIERYQETGKIDVPYLSRFMFHYENLPKINELKNDPNFSILQKEIVMTQKYAKRDPKCPTARYATNFSCNKYEKLMLDIIAELPQKENNTKIKVNIK